MIVKDFKKKFKDFGIYSKEHIDGLVKIAGNIQLWDCIGVQIVEDDLAVLEVMSYDKNQDGSLTFGADKIWASVCDSITYRGIWEKEDITERNMVEAMCRHIDEEIFWVIKRHAETIRLPQTEGGLGFAIDKVGNIIARETRRGTGNKLIISQETARELGKHPEDIDKIQHLGQFNGKMDIVCLPDTMIEKIDIYIGYRGDDLGLFADKDSSIIMAIRDMTFPKMTPNEIGFKYAIDSGFGIKDNIGSYFKKLNYN